MREGGEAGGGREVVAGLALVGILWRRRALAELQRLGRSLDRVAGRDLEQRVLDRVLGVEVDDQERRSVLGPTREQRRRLGVARGGELHVLEREREVHEVGRPHDFDRLRRERRHR